MSIDEASRQAGTIATGLVGAVVAAGFALQKIRKAWNTDGAEADVVKLLRDEVTRLSEQNKKLAENIEKLSTENATLRGELIELRHEIRLLRRTTAEPVELLEGGAS